jgi:signal transduction histidine kinase
VGITADGAARVAWHPNVFAWVAVWRVLVIGQGALALLLPVHAAPSSMVLALGGLYALISIALAMREWRGSIRQLVLGVDLAACIALMAMAHGQASFALMALYSYSTVVSWAAGRPVDAFVAGGIGAAGYVVLGLLGPYQHSGHSSFVSNLALYFFFALATSGFFTVTRRIGALEIATEISKERGRYRRDLHDRLGQALCGLHFELQAVHAIGAGDGADERMRSLADGYRDAQSMLADLFQQGDEPMVATNVGALIQQEARRLSQQTGTQIEVVVDGEPARIPPWMRPHVVAVSGEGMTNALKYGEAGRIDVELSIVGDIVVLSVTDDGVGFDNPPGTLPEKVGHYGLREMTERARICGGEVVVASQPGFGTRIRLQVPLPDGSAEDLIERDAGTLRRNVWSLVTVLRTGLGAVALAQLAGGGARGGGALTLALAAFMLADLVAGVVRREQLFRFLGARPGAAWGIVGVYVGAAAWVTASGATPYFMLYAPLVLLGAAIHGGRRLALRLTVFWAAAAAAVAVAVDQLGRLHRGDADTLLLYLTNMVLIGMCATQGSTLLDRLETLQIRVRYQTLARLRQGLSNRMRDELTERLNSLERVARTLSADPPPGEEFSEATSRLQAGSSELKAKLREIVHQLADPSTPGRTPAHV